MNTITVHLAGGTPQLPAAGIDAGCEVNHSVLPLAGNRIDSDSDSSIGS